MSQELWDTIAEAHSAQAYKIAFYQATNSALVVAGQLQPGMRIVDLACGSGLTTRAILATIGDDCRIFAVDLSGEMLSIMRRSVTSSAVRFVQASADGFAQHIPGRVDRVFCNAAFWHFTDSGAVLQEVFVVLNPEGLFLFNLPDHEFDFGDGQRSGMERLILERLGQPERKAPCRFCHEGIRALAAGNGFAIVSFDIVDMRLRAEDLIRLGSIPPLGAEGYPGASLAERQEILAKAFGHLTLEQLPHYRWAQYTFRPSKEGMR